MALNDTLQKSLALGFMYNVLTLIASLKRTQCNRMSSMYMSELTQRNMLRRFFTYTNSSYSFFEKKNSKLFFSIT